jgi:hypothetical protein
MLRTAKPADAGRIVDLLAETHARSRYADLPFDRRFTFGLVQQAIQRNMGDQRRRVPGGGRRHRPEGRGFDHRDAFRVYLILDALSAKDLFLIASDKASPMAARKLMGAYAEWAERNPKVYEIELTHTDVTPESARMGEVYERMGFEPFGHAYRRANPAFAAKVKEAA